METIFRSSNRLALLGFLFPRQGLQDSKYFEGDN